MQGGKATIVWLILNTLILDILAEVSFRSLLPSNHHTVQEAGGGAIAQVFRVR